MNLRPIEADDRGRLETGMWPETPGTTEIAVTVMDARQGEGVHEFCASVMTDDTPALRLVRSVGGSPVGLARSGVIELRIPLKPQLDAPPRPASGLPSSGREHLDAAKM